MADSAYSPPTPAEPFSAQAIYEKIRDDADYANFIRGQLEVARTGKTEEEREAAVNVLDSHFALSTNELNLLQLPQQSSAKRCACTNTRTTFFLLDFATATQNWQSGE